MSNNYTTRHFQVRSGDPETTRIQTTTAQSSRAIRAHQPSQRPPIAHPGSPTQDRSRADAYNSSERKERANANYEYTSQLSPISPAGTHTYQLPSTFDKIARQLSLQTHSSSSYSESMPTRTNSTATSISNCDENVYHFAPLHKYDCVITIYQYSMGRKELKGSAQVTLNLVRQCFKALPLGSLGTRREGSGRRIVSLFEVVIHEPVMTDSFISLLGIVHGFSGIPHTGDLNYFYELAVASYVFKCPKEWIGNDESWKNVRRALTKEGNLQGSTLKWIVIAAAFGWEDLLKDMSRRAILMITDENKLDGLQVFLAENQTNLRDVLLNRRAALKSSIQATLAEKSEEFNIKWSRESYPSVHALIYQLLIGQVAGNGALSQLQAHKTSPRDIIDTHLTIIRKHLNTAIQSLSANTRVLPSIRSGSSGGSQTGSRTNGATSNRNRNVRAGATSRIIKDFLNTIDLTSSKSKKIPIPKQTKEDAAKAKHYADMKALELCCKDLIATFERLEREVQGLKMEDFARTDYPRHFIELPQARGDIHELEGSFVPFEAISEKPLPATPNRFSGGNMGWIAEHERSDSDTVPKDADMAWGLNGMRRNQAPITDSYLRSPLSGRHGRTTSELIERAYLPTPDLARFYDDCVDDPQTNVAGHTRSASVTSTPRIHFPMQPILNSPDDDDSNPNTSNTIRPHHGKYSLQHSAIRPPSHHTPYFYDDDEEEEEYEHKDRKLYHGTSFPEFRRDRASSQSCITDTSFRTEDYYRPLPPLPKTDPKQRTVPKPLKLDQKVIALEGGLERLRPFANDADSGDREMQKYDGITKESVFVGADKGAGGLSKEDSEELEKSWLTLSSDSTPREGPTTGTEKIRG